MALYAAIGAEFKRAVLSDLESLLDERIKSVITQTLKQVAHDYELDYKELKSRYCSKESLDEYEFPGHTQVVTVDLEEKHSTEAPEVPKKESKAVVPKAVMALSKMKKGDLVLECEERGLDSEGTVSQLKERLKAARDGEGTAPVKKSSAPKKEKAASKPKEKAKPKEKKKAVVPPPPPVALEEDEEEDPDEDEDICQRVDEEFEDEDEDDTIRLQRNLQKILAEAEEEEDYEDEE
jgi:hypothetical protein